MKLLIITQVVDTEDSYLGFFVRWIEEFAKHAERIEVICLREGKHDLPANVRVHSLGKERGAVPASGLPKGSHRAAYAWRFLSLAWRLRHDYDAIFVHMNPEYVVLVGPLWRLWGKRVALWYTHKSVNLKLRVAAFFANIIFTASKESFRLKSSKVHVMGHGIDTDFFCPETGIARGDWILSVGRLMPSKRHDLAIQTAILDGRALRIAGEGPERARLEALAREQRATVQFLGPLTQTQLRDEYRTAAYFIHTSETGSLDKVVLEALACGLPVITTATSLANLPVTVVAATPSAIAKEVLATRQAGTESLAAYVKEHHSLQHLVPAILHKMFIA